MRAWMVMVGLLVGLSLASCAAPQPSLRWPAGDGPLLDSQGRPVDIPPPMKACQGGGAV